MSNPCLTFPPRDLMSGRRRGSCAEPSTAPVQLFTNDGGRSEGVCSQAYTFQGVPDSGYASISFERALFPRRTLFPSPFVGIISARVLPRGAPGPKARGALLLTCIILLRVQPTLSTYKCPKDHSLVTIAVLRACYSKRSDCGELAY